MEKSFESPSPDKPEEAPRKLQSWDSFIASPEQPPTEQEAVTLFDEEMGAAFTHVVRTPTEKREETMHGLNHFLKERLTEIKPTISSSMNEADVKESLARTLALAGDMLRQVSPDADPLERPAAHVALTVLRPDHRNGQWSLIGATAGITKVYVYRKATDEVQQVNIEDNRAGARSPIIAASLYNTKVARQLQEKLAHVKNASDLKTLASFDEYLFNHRNEASGSQLVGERVSQSDLDSQRRVVPAKTFAITHLHEGDYVLLGGATLDAVDQATLKKLLLKALASNEPGSTLAQAIAKSAADTSNVRKTPGPVALGILAVPPALPPVKPVSIARMLEADPFFDEAPTREVGQFEGATSYADLYTILGAMPPGSIIEEKGTNWTPAAVIVSLRYLENGIKNLSEVHLPDSIMQKVEIFSGKKE